MRYPIKELIVRDVVEALKGVRIASGYSADLTVRRGRRQARGGYVHGETTLHQLDEQRDAEADSYPILGWRLPLVAEVTIVRSEDMQEAEDTIANCIDADIKKALMIDEQRGNHPDTHQKLAQKTELGATAYFDEEEGGQIVRSGILVLFTVQFRTLENDPYSLG